MSIDSRFAAVNFPALKHPHQEAAEEQSRVQGHAAGYASGLRAAAREAEARVIELNAETAAMMNERGVQIDAALAALDQAARDLHARALPTVEQAQQVLTESAIELAEAILGYELADGAKTARAALARVLDHVESTSLLAIRMNPADIAEIEKTGTKGSREISTVALVPDPSLARGDAIGDYADGYLDARIGSALKRARTALLEELR